MNSRPDPSEYIDLQNKYIKLVPDGNIIDILTNQQKSILDFLKLINEERSNYKYAEGKWNVKEVVGHISDSERIFGYRTLCFSRKDKNPLPGFEQNDFIANANFNNIPFSQIVEELNSLRTANILLFKGISNEMWKLQGMASNNKITVLALAYLIVGHTQHHINVLKEKYGC